MGTTPTGTTTTATPPSEEDLSLAAFKLCDHKDKVAWKEGDGSGTVSSCAEDGTEQEGNGVWLWTPSWNITGSVGTIKSMGPFNVELLRGPNRRCSPDPVDVDVILSQASTGVVMIDVNSCGINTNRGDHKVWEWQQYVLGKAVENELKIYEVFCTGSPTDPRLIKTLTKNYTAKSPNHRTFKKNAGGAQVENCFECRMTLGAESWTVDAQLETTFTTAIRADPPSRVVVMGAVFIQCVPATIFGYFEMRYREVGCDLVYMPGLLDMGIDVITSWKILHANDNDGRTSSDVLPPGYRLKRN